MKKIYVMFILASILVLSGCGALNNKSDKNVMDIYYINSEKFKIVAEKHVVNNQELIGKIHEVAELLATKPEDPNLTPVLHNKISIEDITIKGSAVTIYFGSGYYRLKAYDEILIRAAIVKSIGNIEGVETVEFIVAGIPLVNLANNEIGPMKSSDFIDNLENGVVEDNIISLTLYYADKSGTKLVRTVVDKEIKGNNTIEKEIIETLIKGIEDKKQSFACIPAGTKLLKVYVKNNICYVDLNQEFLTGIIDVSPEVTVYSIVNSLTEQDNITSVQFMINGNIQATYREVISFDKLFKKKRDIIK